MGAYCWVEVINSALLGTFTVYDDDDDDDDEFIDPI
jgi:hypothetical protein